MSTPVATVVITTKNRKEELGVALTSCFTQSVPLEVIVIDDGSSDGTDRYVRENFPDAKLFRFERSRGLIAQRNFGATQASTNYIFSIDDDAEYSSEKIVETTLAEFSHPSIAAIAIPFININQDKIVRQISPEPSEIWITNEYIGTAHAILRDVFLSLGGYREMLIHQGEEGDFCIRLLNQGNFVRLGSSDPIYHYESPKRSSERVNVFGQRNLILFAWQNVPIPYLFVHLPGTIINGIIWGIRNQCALFRLKGLLIGVVRIFMGKAERKPVKHSAYRFYRNLKKRGPRTLTEAQDNL